MTAGGSNSIWNREFWKTTTELAVRSGAHFALVGMSAAGVGDYTDAWHLPWKLIVGMVLTGMLLSVLTSLDSTRRGPKGSPLITAKPVGDG